MNRISIHQDQQEWKETLSDAEMQELLSVRGITVSRTSEILKAKSPITVSSALKKIWMRKHFSELPPQDNARLVAFTNAWVMALLEQLKPTNRKKTTGQENISPIKPREPGILFADFEKEFRKIPNRPSIMPIWTQLIQHYPAYFTIVKSASSGKSIYQLKEVCKEDAIRLAKDHIQRGNSPAVKKRASA